MAKPADAAYNCRRGATKQCVNRRHDPVRISKQATQLNFPLSGVEQMSDNARDVTKEELRAFVGQNADYYFEKWRSIGFGMTGKAALNAVAALFSPLWMLYRKFYVLLFAFLIFVHSEVLLEELIFVVWLSKPDVVRALDVIITFVNAIIIGSYANYWYYHYACWKIRKIKAIEKDPQKQIQLIARKGGTSLLNLGVPVILIAAFTTIARYGGW